MNIKDFKLPEIGEGVMEGEVVEWFFQEGASIQKDEPAVSILTDKATVEIACPFSGTLKQILKKQGEGVLVGAPIARIEVESLASDSSIKEPDLPAESITPFPLPEIGEGVMEGELIEWKVKPGDPVNKDQVLFSVLTDKATIEITSPYKGRVLQIFIAKGDTAIVGEPVLTIHTANGTTLSKEKKNMPPQLAQEEPVVKTPSMFQGSTIPLASPAVRKKARELGIDLLQIPRNSTSDRITMKDLNEWVVPPVTSHGTPEKPLQTLDSSLPGKRVPIKGLRKAIFTNMALSKKMVPHFTYVEEVEMDALIGIRDDLKQDAQNAGIQLSFLPFIIKAAILALKQFPVVNTSVDEEKEEVIYHSNIHIGVAASTERGLMVPVIKHAAQWSLFELAQKVTELSNKARNMKTSLDEVTGGTFTITSLGRLGGLLATPIINYPESAIMGIHEIKERPVVRKGQITIRNMMNLTGSFDHRIIDGDIGAAFIQCVKAFLEHPARLLNL